MAKASTKHKKSIEVPVVAIGYSAGGLEAVQRLLGSLSDSTGMAFVIIQHLKDDQESHLRDILAKSTPMNVKEMQEQTPIKPNTVFVLPPGYDAELTGNSLRLSPRDRSPSLNLAIDFFFSSLSQSRQSRAVGIVLSGTGADGTEGLRAIKSEGGITIVQDPKTARFDAMPRSAIASGVADLILSPAEIGKELERIAKHPYTKSNLNCDAEDKPESNMASGEQSKINQILDLLSSDARVDLTKYKMNTIKRRIERQMMLRKIETIDHYTEHLKKNPEDAKALYEDIFIHVTEFFRDEEAFEAIRQNVFPVILKDKNSSTPIRIWVPGCSTGEEVYSLAIMLAEYLEEHSLDTPFSIFGGDVSEPSIQVARKAFYADYQIRNVSIDRLEKFFERVKGGYKVKKNLRDLCIFSRHDVTSNPPIPNVDLVSCRNVFIYFSADLQKRIFPVFHYALKKDGFLWLGRAESTAANTKLFKTIDKVNKIFAKAGTTFTPQHHFSSPIYSGTESQIRTPSAPVQHGPLASADQVMLFRYSPPSVVIDSNLEVVNFRGRTVPYLEPPTGGAHYSLLKMANPDIANALRVCIQTAKKENGQARKEGIEFKFEGKKRRVNIDVTPLNLGATPKDRLLLVVFEDAAATDAAGKVRPVKPAKKIKTNKRNQVEALIQHNAQLQQELEASREYQQSLAEEYESTQEELTSANEELRSANEELQSTNEELHSTNEELGTAKEELQAANEELLSMNDELQKRNQELEIALRDLEKSEERFRLMVDGVKDYAIFMIDPQGIISSWNEGAKRLKGFDRNEIIGQSFSRFYTQEDIQRGHPKEELEEARSKGRYEEEGWRVRKDGSRFWANVLITRIDDANGNLIGYSKVTRDLTERKRYESELKQANESLEGKVKERTGQLAASEERLKDSERQLRSLVDSIPQLAWMARGDGHIFWYNKRWYEYTGTTPEQMEGWGWKEVHDPVYLPKVLEEWQKSLSTGESFEMEFPIKSADGRYRWFLTRIIPVRDSRGKIVRWFGTNTDIEEQRNIREQLKRAVKMRDEFLSIASHELKTPLTTLKLEAQLTIRGIESNDPTVLSQERVAHLADQVDRRVNKLQELINDMTDVSRIENGSLPLDPHPTNISDIIKEAIETYSLEIKRAGCELCLEIQDKIQALVDRSRIEQVILNLISNATKYAAGKPIEIKASATNDKAVLVFRDHGIGISQSDQVRIFNRFERAISANEVSGLGLGLYISKEILRLHQGNISVRSELRKGSEFTVTFPLWPQFSSIKKESKSYEF